MQYSSVKIADQLIVNKSPVVKALRLAKMRGIWGGDLLVPRTKDHGHVCKKQIPTRSISLSPAVGDSSRYSSS